MNLNERLTKLEEATAKGKAPDLEDLVIEINYVSGRAPRPNDQMCPPGPFKSIRVVKLRNGIPMAEGL